jgi:hypothetical protein
VSDLLALLESETALLNRLRQLRCAIGGLRPTIGQVREAILEQGIEHVICGRDPNGKSRTFAQMFEITYKQPLGIQVRRKRSERLEA